ncbi:MAG: NUDIX hydrolase [Spirochaetia bacterium]|nr:NUDIX hydrolase [Spirochaetia bacterium]
MVAGDGSGSILWQTVDKREAYRGHIFTVFEKTSRGPDGRQGTFSVLESRDWAVVVPLVRSEKGGSFLMVRQYRHGADAISLEFPGGVIEPDEAPIEAAQRELAEETGWVSKDVTQVADVFPNPAIQSNHFHIFLALDPTPAVDRNLDEHEIVDAVLVPASEVRNMMGEGEYRHALMATALFMAEKALLKRGIRIDL